jgi:hypothetical protein
LVVVAVGRVAVAVQAVSFLVRHFPSLLEAQQLLKSVAAVIIILKVQVTPLLGQILCFTR